MNTGNEQRAGAAPDKDSDEKLQGNLQRSHDSSTIPSHPSDPAARGEADKVVGEASPHFRDYNDPPPEGASKSTGRAIDEGVGGALGQPPRPARENGEAQELPATGDNGMITEAQSGGDQIADEMKGVPPAR